MLCWQCEMNVALYKDIFKDVYKEMTFQCGKIHGSINHELISVTWVITFNPTYCTWPICVELIVALLGGPDALLLNAFTVRKPIICRAHLTGLLSWTSEITRKHFSHAKENAFYISTLNSRKIMVQLFNRQKPHCKQTNKGTECIARIMPAKSEIHMQ